ncbi:MAG: Nif3-like dinuclear metal center hexameric protein, partial [Sedimentisphaerales bacterium]|nr:Nif3-like dinuclear metal center hexameric protein [Sedimentisphaerales bacterium]
MKLGEIGAVLERMAPTELAADWDNVGLLAGDPDQPIRRILLTIDLTGPVLAEAKRLKAGLIVAYHPPIWEPLKRIVAGRGPAPLLYEVVRRGMAVYTLHTALDAVRGGVNDLLAKLVGIVNPQILQAQDVQTGAYCKLVVFLPESDQERISEALFAAGAGRIGAASQYGRCSFRCRGVGTFQGDAASHPTVGRPGRFEQVEEIRLETVLPTARLAAAVQAMLAAHSYEEVAYDVYPLLKAPQDAGLGRYGDLAEPVPAAELIERIKKALKLPTVGLIGPARRIVRRAAVGAGSCGFLLRDVI